MNKGILVLEADQAPGAALWTWIYEKKLRLGFVGKSALMIRGTGVPHLPWNEAFVRVVGVAASRQKDAAPPEFSLFAPRDRRNFEQMISACSGNPNFPALIAVNQVEDAVALSILDKLWNCEEAINRAIHMKRPVGPILQSCSIAPLNWAYLVGLYYEWPASYFLTDDDVAYQEMKLIAESGVGAQVLESW